MKPGPAAVVAAAVVLAACGGGGDDTASTTAAITTVAAATTATTVASTPPTTAVATTVAVTTSVSVTIPPTTMPPSPWHEADISGLADLDVTRPVDVRAGAGGLLLTGTTATGEPLVATSVDGSGWLPAVGLDGAFFERNGGWAVYRAQPTEPDGNYGVTELQLRYPEGWEVAAAAVPGLEYDGRVTDSQRYVRKPIDQALQLADGTVIGLGGGGNWKSRDTGDQTSWLGRSADGTAWTFETLDHAGGDRIFPLALLDTSDGPVAAGQFSGADGTHLMVWSLKDGFTPVFDQILLPPYGGTSDAVPPGEEFDVQSIEPLPGAPQPTFLVSGSYQQQLVSRLLTADASGQWKLEDLPVSDEESFQVYDTIGTPPGITLLATGHVPDSDRDAQTMLVTLGSGAPVTEAPDELSRAVPIALSRLPNGELFVLARSSDGPVAFTRDAS